MLEVQGDSSQQLQIIVTGMHLREEFGSTVQEILDDGFEIDKSIDILTTGDSPLQIASAIGNGVSRFATALDELKPDILVILGDRFEAFAGSTSALLLQIPIAHIHGGESTEGLVDEAFRHSITKMSQLHFVSAPLFRETLVQMGEQPANIHVVGGMGIDAINDLQLLSLEKLETKMKFTFGRRNLLVTFHPVTLERNTAETQARELVAALSELSDTKLILTLPNIDTGSAEIIRIFQQFQRTNPNVFLTASLGQEKYYSCLRYVDGVIGNSSSGLLEAPSFKIGTVNIGDRQRGRLKSASVIDCLPIKEDILRAINKIFTSDFQLTLLECKNPYGEPGASKRIHSLLSQANLENIMKKSFHRIQAK